MVAEAIHLEGVDGAELGMVVGGISLQGRLNLIGQCTALSCQAGLSIDCLQYLRRLAQGADGKEVGRNEELQCRGVVRRTEARDNQPDGTDGSSQAVVVQGVERTLRLALELIGACALLALLLAEGGIDIPDGIQPFGTEDGGVARHLPIMVGQTQGITEGVNLPFALVQFGLHVGEVGHPVAVGHGTVVEGIGVRIDVDALELAQDDTGQHLLQGRVIVG